MMRKEEIASTTTRLLHHLDRLIEIQNHVFRPITLHIAPTDKCNLNCCFCSVKNRDMLELDLGTIKKVVDTYVDAGILSVEITGGGEPTLYPYINELIEYCLKKRLKIGMISNGVKLNKLKHIRNLSWVRISMNGLDYDKEFPIKKVCLTPGVLVGMSYVWNKKSNKNILQHLYDISKECRIKYVRIVPNCYKPEHIELTRKIIPPLISQYENFFLQIKNYDVYPKCYMGRLKPFLNSDGYIYHCSTNSLFEGKFGKSFRMGPAKDVKKIISDPPIIDTKKCKLCFYGEQNELINTVLTEIFTPEFI